MAVIVENVGDKPIYLTTSVIKQLQKIDWNLDYGSVKIQIRQGKPALITIERTVKLD